jgi:hypothetical protein
VCSNRAATQANVLKTQEKNCAENIPILQAFCKLGKSSAKPLASLIRKRSLVRVQAGPPEKSFDLQVKSIMG